MTKIYTLAETDVDVEQKTITISEEVAQTKENKITIAQLKENYARKLEQIAAAKVEANEIVDEITAIETNLKLEVTEKPPKLK